MLNQRLPRARSYAAFPSTLALFLFVAACSDKAAQTSAPAADAPLAGVVPGKDSAALPVAQGTHAATSGALGVPSEAYVTQSTFVRRLASEVKEVSVPGHKKRQANWLATLNRGEHVHVLEEREGWLRVQSSDETRGWIKAEGVLVGPQISQATNLGPLRRFTRPDLLALVPGKPVDAGSLLFVLRQKEAFSEVNYAGSATAWVLTDALERAEEEVAAAKLLHRARQLSERHEAAAEGLFELAKGRFAHTRIVAVFFPPPMPEAVEDSQPALGSAPLPEPEQNPLDVWTQPGAGPPDTGLPSEGAQPRDFAPAPAPAPPAELPADLGFGRP